MPPLGPIPRMGGEVGGLAEPVVVVAGLASLAAGVEAKAAVARGQVAWRVVASDSVVAHSMGRTPRRRR